MPVVERKAAVAALTRSQTVHDPQETLTPPEKHYIDQLYFQNCADN